MLDHNTFANLIWQIADLLRGPYRPPQYERVMLPMTVLRRFDCVLAPTKAQVLAEHARRAGGKLNDDALDLLLNRAAGQRFHNHSPLDFEKLKGDPDHIDRHLVSYIKGFSANVRTIFDFFEFESEIEKMREVIRLMVSILFINDDALLATPGTVRKLLDPTCGTGGMLAEAQNYLREHHAAARLYVYGQDYNKRAFATAASDMLMKQVDHNGGGDNVRYGDSFTDDQFSGERYDYLLANPPFGVDWKKQQREIERERDKLGYAGRFGAGLPRVNDGSLLFLQHMISKFEPVLPDQQKYGSRLAIVFSGSPLFTGGAGAGESDIRKWIIENDWLEAVIALPEQMFYNTGIGTYIWIVTNRKEPRPRGRFNCSTRAFYVPMRRSLGDKRRKIGEKEDGRDQISEIVRLYGRFEDGETSKIFANADFGATCVTVERPLRLRYRMTGEAQARFLETYPELRDDVQAVDETLGREPSNDWDATWATIGLLLRGRGARWKAPEQKLFRNVFTVKDPVAAPVRLPSPSGRGAGGEGVEPDPDLRDFENVPLTEDIAAYFTREVLPHVPDAWMDRGKDKVGYEINFNRHFYKYTAPRSLEVIDADLKQAEEEILRLLREVTT
ncbi:MAG: class I SAM-dependent DNA methyltransferase [Anaerolineae bacterium]